MDLTAEGIPEHWSEQAAKLLRPVFDLKKPTALLLGRYQPFHDGHKALIIEAIERVGQACVAVRDTHGTDENNPFSFEYVRSRIEHGLRAYEGRFNIILMPNITNVFYGSGVGYKIERIDLTKRCRRSRRPRNASRWGRLNAARHAIWMRGMTQSAHS